MDSSLTTPETPPPNRLSLYTIYYLSFFCSFGNPIMVPVYPQVMTHFNVTPVEIGLLVSLYALPGLLVIPLLGFLQDRLGRRPILLGSLVLCLIGSYGFAMTDSFGLFLACRLLQGLAVTPLEAMSTTLISDNFDGPVRAKYVGRNISAMYIGVAIFPVLSTAIMHYFGWRAALLTPCFLVLPLLVLIARLPMPYHKSTFRFDTYRANLKSLFSSPDLLKLFGIRIFSALIVFGTIHTYLPFLVKDKLGGGQNLPGLFFALYSACMAFSSLFANRATVRFSVTPVAVTASLGMVLGLVGFTFAPSLTAVAACIGVYGLGSGALMSLVTAYVALAATPDTKATVISLSSTAFRAAQTFSGPVASLLYTVGSFTLLYATASGAALLMTLLVFFTFSALRR